MPSTTARKPTQYREAPIRHIDNELVLYTANKIFSWRFTNTLGADREYIYQMWDIVTKELISRCVGGL